MLVEGGRGIITSLLNARLVDRIVAIVAPKIIGRGIDAVGDLGITTLDDAIVLKSVQTTQLGADIVIDSDVPIGGGLSSSAALEIAIGKALTEISEVEVDPVKLALAAQEAEHKFAGAKVD